MVASQSSSRRLNAPGCSWCSQWPTPAGHGAVGRVGGAVISVRTGSLAGAGGGPPVVVVAHGCRSPHPMAHFRSSVALDTTADEAFGFLDDDTNLRAIVTEVEPDDHGPGGGAAALDS